MNCTLRNTTGLINLSLDIFNGILTVCIKIQNWFMSSSKYIFVSNIVIKIGL